MTGKAMRIKLKANRQTGANGKAMRIKLKANRQTGANGVRAPTHWRSASVVGKDEDLLSRRSPAIIGAATRRISGAAARKGKGAA